MNEYQEFVRDCASPKYDKNLALIGLVGEVGELADVIKKEAIYEDMSLFEQKYGMSVRDKVRDEAGDVLWQLVNLLNQYDITLEDLMAENMDKLKNRHGGKGTKSNGGQR